MNTNLSFACDYMEGCHPAILEKLTETNLIKTPGYGLDDYTRSACEKIKSACRKPEAQVFLSYRRHTNKCHRDLCNS